MMIVSDDAEALALDGKENFEILNFCQMKKRTITKTKTKARRRRRKG